LSEYITMATHPFAPVVIVRVINGVRYYKTVIKTFANPQAAEIWRTGKTHGGPPSGLTRRKLVLLDAATELEDLRVPSGNRLEKLRGNRRGQYSIRMNDRYRLGFAWRSHDAYEVAIVD
jgi:proteic killer suppression protein